MKKNVENYKKLYQLPDSYPHPRQEAKVTSAVPSGFVLRFILKISKVPSISTLGSSYSLIEFQIGLFIGFCTIKQPIRYPYYS